MGISDFHSSENHTLPRIPFAAKDAVRLYKTLRDFGDFDPHDMRLLVTSKPEDASIAVETPTRANILSALSELASNAKSTDLFLLFIASHGFELSEVPYIATPDTRMNVVDSTAIHTEGINKYLRTSSARFVVRIFDACRAPYAVGRSPSAGMTPRFAQSMFASGNGWATISSCSSGEVSYETGEFEQGVFSYYLCEGIEGEAADDNGLLTLELLVNYVKISVVNWAKQQSIIQTPHLHADMSGTLLLSTRPKAKSEEPHLSPAHPLSALKDGLLRELSATALDVRSLQFTSDETNKQFIENTKHSIAELLSQFRCPEISLELVPLDRNRIESAGHNCDGDFNEDVKNCGVNIELVGRVWAIQVLCSSNHVIVPRTRLFIVCARFSFFYWLWYKHVCHVTELQHRFMPNPAHRKGFITMSSSAGQDLGKVSLAVSEVFSRCAATTVEWTGQLREFIDNRVDPLRKMDTIIQ